MGGAPKQVNSGQASAADAATTKATDQSIALSKQYGGQESQIFNTLFGNGTPGSSGTLTKMMDPSSLNTGAPTGAYQTAWNNAQNNIAKSYAQQKGSLAQGWANSGMGSNSTPSGFQADQQRKLGSSEADTRGNTYTGIVGQQHGDALNNFWNASNIASGQQGSATSGSTTGAGNAATAQSNLFGTAGRQAQTGTSAATGITESALCPAEGSMIRMADHSQKPIEELKKGDKIQGIDGKPDELIEEPQSSVQEICEVRTSELKTKVSLTHAFVRQKGGYTIAARSLGELVDTAAGPKGIIEVRMSGERMICFHLFLKRSHGYEADGFWGLE